MINNHKSRLAMAIKAMNMLTVSVATLTLAPMATAQSNDSVEEILVTGIRASLTAATDVKRNSDRISDAIVAEDIGKLPDNNIAEALQRITGVSINSDFGVGTGVSIRGLSENRVELNGRSTVGDSRDGVSLEDFPSSFLKSVEVVKSPTADMIEGALGGTVAMRTIRPLELKKLTIAGSLDGEYADKTENWAPIFNASIGNNWDLGDAGTFGASAMLAYQDREIRQDEFFNRVQLYSDNDNGLSANTPSGKFVVRDQNTVEQYVDQRERTAANFTLQWSPASGDGNFYLDLATTDRSGSQAGSSILDVTSSSTARVYDADSTQDAGGQVNHYDITKVLVIPKSKSTFRSTKSESYALGGEWNFTDKLKVSGELSLGSSDTSTPATEFNLRPTSRSIYESNGSATDYTATVSVDQSGNKIPSIVYSDPNILTNPDNLAIRQFFHDDTTIKNEEKAARFDVDYSDVFDQDWFTSLKAGVRVTQGDYNYDLSRFRIDNLYKDVTKDGVRHIVWIDDFESMFPGSIKTVHYANSFNQAGLSGQNDLLTYSVYDPARVGNANAIFNKVQTMLDGTNKALTGTLTDNMVRQKGSYRDITEDTSAMYVSAHLDFDVLKAVAGVRYVETEVTSRVYAASGDLVSGSHTYDDLLPSLNLSSNLSDDTIVRFAAAKVMRRPDYGQLSPAFDIDNSIVTASAGAIDLDPHRATQYDLSLEHYFGSGNMVSAAIFYKDVKSFLSSTTTCVASPLTQSTPQNVTEYQNVCLLNTAGVDNPNLEFATAAQGLTYVTGLRDQGLTGIRTSKVTNGENGKVQGLELGYQQIFDFLPGAWSGLGVGANYTYADSEQPNGNELLNISKNTFNAQVFWEYDTFQVRFAYNYRDKFLSSEEEKRVETIGALALGSATNSETDPNYDSTAGNNYQDSRGQLDVSASWDINDNITLATNITNLLGAPTTFSSELGSKWMYTEADRRFTLGVRAKF